MVFFGHSQTGRGGTTDRLHAAQTSRDGNSIGQRFVSEAGRRQVGICGALVHTSFVRHSKSQKKGAKSRRRSNRHFNSPVLMLHWVCTTCVERFSASRKTTEFPVHCTSGCILAAQGAHSHMYSVLRSSPAARWPKPISKRNNLPS
jgi:hypothetical protein